MAQPYQKLHEIIPWLSEVIDDTGILRLGYGVEPCVIDQICWHYIHEYNSFGSALQAAYEELGTFHSGYVWNLAPWCGVKNGRIIHGVAMPDQVLAFEFLFLIATKHIATAQPDIIVAAETTTAALHIFKSYY